MRSIVFILFFLAGWLSSAAQNVTNKGRDFWVGYGHHQFMEPGQTNGQEMVLYFSAEDQPAHVIVTVRGRTATQVTPYDVPANTVIASNYIPKSGPQDARLYDVPPSFGGNGGEAVFNMSIHIESDVPIVAYAHIFGSVSSGATMLMPTEAWGHTYTSINSQQIDATGPGFSWVYVVAKEDNTVVQITPSVGTRLNKPPGVPFNVTLQKGQIYQLVGQSNSNGDGNQFTGTTVKSIANGSGECYPIAVFSGSSRTRGEVAFCGSGGGRDNDMQQCFPRQAWGKRYLTAPFSKAGSGGIQASTFQTSVYKIVVKEPGTQVRRNGAVITPNSLGYYEFSSNQGELIEADRPIMVAQFMSGGSSCANGSLGDPEMVFLSPIEQAIKRVGFYRNDRQNINYNYVTLIVPSAGLASLSIDGSNSFSHTYDHPRLPGYKVVVKGWPSARVQCQVRCDSAFTAITYGMGSAESYAYNAGTYLNNLNAIGDLRNVPDTSSALSHPFTCTNTPVKLSVLMAYKPTRMEWKLSTLASVMTPNADVVETSPVPVDTVAVNGIKYYKYTLPLQYSFSAADTFEIPIVVNHPDIDNCHNREDLKINVLVKERPKPDFTYIHSGCSADSIHFTGSNTTSNGFTPNQFTWTFPGSVTATGQNVAQLLPAGTQPVKLTIVSSEGCVGDTTKSVNVGGRPVASFTVSPASICEGGSITFTDNSPAASLNGWYWDFGNGNVSDGATNNPQTISYPGYGRFTIRHAVRSSATCVSDTVQQVVDVYANPRLGFNYPAGCLPDNGVVQFTSTTTTPDNQVLSTYSWNFGDSGATPTNPNTSSAANPTHTYTNYGSYPIQYSVTTANGCRKDTLVNAVFNLRPKLAFAAVPALCENAAPVSVANGSVTNGVTGTGVYHGAGTSAAGLLDPSVAGAGLHRIWYVFTSDAGCTDSVYIDVRVHAKPVPSFSFPSAICATSGSVTFTNTTTIADAAALTYAWTFNDAASTGSNPNTATSQHPTHVFGNNTYDVHLQVTSANNCTAETASPVSVSLKPQVAYAALASVCHTSSGSFSVASGSVTNGLTGSGFYSGTGTDAAGQFTPSIAGAGTHQLWYHFTTTSGCIDSASATIKVHPRPQASFSVTPSICLDATGTVTDNSSISSGRIVSWNWNLGNGNTPSYSNNAPFSISYASANTYSIQLTAVSDSGCSSEPVTQNITVHPLPLADFSLPPTICMPGGLATFTNTSNVPGGGGSYQWNFGDASPLSNDASPTHNYAAAGSYPVTLTVTTNNGCSHDTLKNLSSFSNKPVVDFTVNSDTLCQGTESIFTDITAAPGSPIATRSWDFGDGSSGSGDNPRKTYSSPGSYDVRLTVTTDAGCSEDSIKQVIVFLQPVIDAGPSFVVPTGSFVQLRPTANDSASLQFEWTPAGDLLNPFVLSAALTAVRNQTYTLTATGAGNCTASDTVSVRILNPLNIPNAFSPNGDGINDTWNIGNLADYPGAGVEVFNRYGQKVYSASGYSVPWDGRSNGKPLPIGTYYYVITLRNGFAPLSGSITILK